MKAGVLYSNENIKYDDYPTPEISDDELLVRVRASGICGSDIPRVLNNGAHYYPVVLGHEFAGEVLQIGKNAAGFKIGERVTGAPLVPCMNCIDCDDGNYSLCKNYTFIGSRIQGSFAEYLRLPVLNTVKFDSSVSFEQGAFFEPSTVALHGIKCADYKKNGDVAILGGGTIGLFTMQWAKILGAKSVSVFDISDERLALAKELGADFTVNTLNEKLEKGRYNYVFETAGQVATMHMAFEIAANKSSVCFIGTPHEDLTFAPKLWESMNRKEFKLTGSWMSYSAPFPGDEWTMTADYFKTGQLKFSDKLIHKKYPLSDIYNAFMEYKTPQNVKGKIMLVI